MSPAAEHDQDQLAGVAELTEESGAAGAALESAALGSAAALGNQAFQRALLRTAGDPSPPPGEGGQAGAAEHEGDAEEGEADEDLDDLDESDPEQAKAKETRKRARRQARAQAAEAAAGAADGGGPTAGSQPSPADQATAARLARAVAIRNGASGRPAPAGIAGRQLQRLNTTVHPNLGTSSDPSNVNIIASGAATALTAAGPSTSGNSYIPFDAPVETVQLDEDVTGGLARFRIFYGWTIVNMLVNDHGYGSWEGSLPYTVEADQRVTFGSVIIGEQTTGGSGATFTVNTGSGATPGGGYATAAAGLSSSSSVTTGGSIGVGPISGSAPIQGTTGQAGGYVRSFTINLRPRAPQPITGPQVAFKVGNAQLEDGQEGAVASWFRALPESAQAAIRNGRRTINVSGYASTTARRRRNRDLSEQRARVVERILRGMAGSNASINVFFFGEDATSGPDEREDPTFRRATVQVTAPTTAAAAAPGALPAGRP